MAPTPTVRGFGRSATALAVSVSIAWATSATAQWDAEPLDASGSTDDVAVETPTPSAPALATIASSWRTEPGAMPLPVIEAATVLRERHLAVLGGVDPNFEATSAIQILDPRRGWLPIGSQLASPRRRRGRDAV